MFGLMTVAKHREELERLEAKAERMRNEAICLSVDAEHAEDLLHTIRRLEAEIAANARFVEIGKRRVEALERAKAKKAVK